MAAAFGLAGCAELGQPRPEPSAARTAAPPAETVSGLELLGEATLEQGLTFGETVVGGLSGITYDPQRDRFYAICDDASTRSPARFYTLRIDLAGGRLAPGGLRVEAVTLLVDRAGRPFERLVMDAEGIALTPRRTLLVSSEGNVREGVPPSLREFGLGGRELREIQIPARYLPRPGREHGVRHNKAFEALALTAAGDGFYLATENAIVQDGPAADFDQGSPVRIGRYAAVSGRLLGEYVYNVEPVAEPPTRTEAFRTNGLVELLHLGDTELLALERSFIQDRGNSVRLFAASTRGATNVRARRRLTGRRAGPYRPVTKRLLLDLTILGIELDNLEGLSFGPRLPDGRRSLVMISDDNFSQAQKTQVLAFGLSAGGSRELQATDP